ncbi:hypothetical protein HOP50_18g82790 [Chloropicon primus]|uniref:Zinc/iron permease n=1 Tax=Chloropicon primus TaxID=1764295 RepID=A0A5B8MY80_9CHLO|nr:hypothetical protein A3770_18p82560 [Chloropicon primus]UPR04934.1 hypothetical protein HOP50_18g82790 [Chloropicon primus]|mmetsp:Transcript_24377/g.52461  ORF Transcript_24377/g.52461 Transcript_24377/m.52461 type:complete len:327 (-) Transcript_24377:837-1817(-)|eukprot:QDZ25738.1 hypothetical protein A3770_18p82560 [Chloropicon primus]
MLDVGRVEDSGWGWVLTCSSLIFVSAIVAGLLPLTLVKVKSIHRITAFGSGLCIGASLALMTPEGFHLLMDAHEKHGLNPGFGGVFLTLGVVTFFVFESMVSTEGHGACGLDGAKNRVGSRQGGRSPRGSFSVECGIKPATMDGSSEPLVDSNLGDSNNTREKKEKFYRRNFKGVATMAVMISHAVADGLVMGSVAATGQQEMNIVVAFAMIAHKVPASFSLATFLVALKWPSSSVVKNMLMFSLSSPLSAILFYSLKYAISASSFDQMLSLVMLFSAGSILYVGFFHMYPEALEASEGKDARSTVIYLVASGAICASMFGFLPDD